MPDLLRMRNEWKYEACDLKLDAACDKPFRANESYALGQCVSHVLVGDTPCCITETITMGKPRMTVFGQKCQVDLVFTTLKWMVVLLIGWVLRHGYLVSGLGKKAFSQGAWLDILDTILFSENLSAECIRNSPENLPAVGWPGIFGNICAILPRLPSLWLLVEWAAAVAELLAAFGTAAFLAKAADGLMLSPCVQEVRF